MNFVNSANSVSPEYTFRPTGVVDRSAGVVDTVNSSHLRYSSLPREIVCTENLTPFKKLLPCDSKVCVKNKDFYLFCVIDSVYMMFQ